LSVPRTLDLPGADGIRLHALEWSEQGVPLVFVHGFGHDAHVWEDFAPALAPHYRTLALTLRGHGDSGRGPHGGHDPALLVRDLERALESLGIARLVLVGHSLGGRVSTEFAGRHPEQLAGLVLVDFGPRLDARGVSRIRSEVASRAAGDLSFASADAYLRVLERHYPGVSSARLARLAQHWLRPRADGRLELKLDLRPADTAAAPSLASAEPELWEALRRLPCPVLVVRGAASDVLSAEAADAMLDALQKGQLAVVPRAGHSVMLDNPEGFGPALTGFVLG
jgi:pimeloyl-ACP methyl ester carboxylesterase